MSTVRELAQSIMPTPAVWSSRQSRETRIKYWRAFILIAFFVVVIGFNLILGTIVVIGGIKNHLNSGADNQVFHAAHVIQPLLDGTFCHFTIYDSATARMLDDHVERCSNAPEMEKKSKTGFNWSDKISAEPAR